MSKLNRREALAYAICAAISVGVFGVNSQLDDLDEGAVCGVLHPIDETAETDCRIAAVQPN